MRHSIAAIFEFFFIAVLASDQSSTSCIYPLTRVLSEVKENMVYVQGGTFTMGATAEHISEAYSSEIPAHSVTLNSFYICKYEVTQELWRVVMCSNPSVFKGDRKPVESVTWDECQMFIYKLNALTGMKFRLPTEAEWEFAARGGARSRGYKYSGSDTLHCVAWSDNDCYRCDYPREVGQRQPNELGLYDMSGNVFEWCTDWYDHDYYKKSPSKNPTGPPNGSYRVARGGGWRFNSKCMLPSHNGDGNSFRSRTCRVSCRSAFKPDHRYKDVGLRLAM